MRRLLVLLCAVAAGLLLWPGSAHAHPLGNFSVNQLGALTFHPDRVTVAYVADLAELPTLQSEPSCTAVAPAFHVTAGGRPLTWTVDRAVFTYSPGAAGLRTSRLECDLSAAADLSAGSTVDVANDFDADRIGWRELTATAAGVHIVDSPLPTVSRSDGLRSYPEDLLSSPPAVRTATLRLAPGGSTGALVSPSPRPPVALPASVLPGWAGEAELTLRDWVAQRELTPWVGLLAVLLALTLGAAHAALPGHGKTVMAAYLAGRQGRPRDALTVGATVTLTHTGGVLLLGLLLTTAAGLAGETVLGWLGVTSGVLVAAIGLSMLLSHRRGTAHTHGPHTHTHGPAGHSHGPAGHAPRPHEHTHGFHDHAPHGHTHEPHDHAPHGGDDAPHSHEDHDAPHHHHDAPHSHEGDDDAHDGGHDHTHGGGHDHEGGHDHAHDGGHDHGGGHDHAHGGGRPSRLAVVGMGIAGGLVPSPSALVVLLGAVALGRTWFGVLLVLAYGFGMAGTLTAAGLLLIKIRDRWPARLRISGRLTRLAPTGTAALVLLVGSALAVRSLVTL
jgi:ABC-type nickel/cobalt efflux system permease component RcnA